MSFTDPRQCVEHVLTAGNAGVDLDPHHDYIVLLLEKLSAKDPYLVLLREGIKQLQQHRSPPVHQRLALVALLLNAASRQRGKPEAAKRLRLLACRYANFSGLDGVAKDVATDILSKSPHAPLWIQSIAGCMDEASYIQFDGLVYFPIPKNASSTLCAAWVAHQHGEITINPHAYFKNPYFETHTIDDNISQQQGFAIIRDPCERLASYYKGNIIERNSLANWAKGRAKYCSLSTKPSWQEFIANFFAYNLCFPDVHHHCLPQHCYIQPARANLGERLQLVPFQKTSHFILQHEGLRRHTPKGKLMTSEQASITDREDLYSFLHSDGDLGQYYHQDISLYSEALKAYV